MTLIGELLIGWLLADLLTGIFHWWEDELGREDWPVVGRWIIAPNRLHHADPLAFTRHGFWARNGDAIIVATVVGILWAWIIGPSALMASTLVGGALTNEVHRLAHQPRAAGPFLSTLQEVGFIQSPKMHAAHHRPPHSANYCVLTDWLNPLLELAGFWRRLERLMGRAA